LQGSGSERRNSRFRESATAESVATEQAAVDAGMTLTDTALAYTRPALFRRFGLRIPPSIIDVRHPVSFTLRNGFPVLPGGTGMTKVPA